MLSIFVECMAPCARGSYVGDGRAAGHADADATFEHNSGGSLVAQ
jgi:hypothetical protein